MKNKVDASTIQVDSVPKRISHRIAAEKAIARFRALDPVAEKTKEVFIHLIVGRGFDVTNRKA